MTLLGLYRPGNAPLHRLPTAAKAILPVVWAILSLFCSDVWSIITLFGTAVVLLSLAAPPWRATVRALFPLVALSVMLGGYHWWRGEPALGIQLSLTMLSLVTVATAVTAATPLNAMIDAIQRAIRPLARIGVPTHKIALSVALMLRAVPQLIDVSIAVRQAARARGLERNPRALVIPLVLRAVLLSKMMGEALHARGLDDEHTWASHVETQGT